MKTEKYIQSWYSLEDEDGWAISIGETKRYWDIFVTKDGEPIVSRTIKKSDLRKLYGGDNFDCAMQEGRRIKRILTKSERFNHEP